MERFEKDFRQWYFKKHCKSNIKYEDLMPHHIEDVFGWFDGLCMSFKWGVYIDFFIEKDLMVEVPFYWGANYWKIEISEREIEEGEDYFIAKLIYEEEDFESLNEAREAALEKAIEIYNQNT
jgi:hypothetical protein